MADQAATQNGSVELTRFFPHPREAVFDAWVNPEKLGKWWGCNDTHSVTAESDQREGGSVRYVMHMSHGDVVCAGTYEAFERPERLVTRCTMGEGTEYAFESTTTVEFVEEDGGTRVRLVQVGLPPMPDCDKIVSKGLHDSVEKLQAFLAS